MGTRALCMVALPPGWRAAYTWIHEGITDDQISDLPDHELFWTQEIPALILKETWYEGGPRPSDDVEMDTVIDPVFLECSDYFTDCDEGQDGRFAILSPGKEPRREAAIKHVRKMRQDEEKRAEKRRAKQEKAA